MSKFTSTFLTAMEERGFLHQCTNESGLNALLSDGPVTAYIGFDCTAPSLHVGSLMQIMVIRWLQQTGNTPIVLIGGATTRIGDPSGRDEVRQLLSNEQIKKNIDGIRHILTQFNIDADVVNNEDWLNGFNYIEFLRDIGSNFSVNRMLTMESVKNRLEREQNLSFLEFNYMLFQAVDFVELYKKRGCRLQIGGADQWGNIVSGIDLGRRMRCEELFGLTTPLITTSTGAKMGKTAQGAVWLSQDLLTSYDYWQFWRNTEDADVGRFLRLFTELPLDEIKKLECLEGSEINEAKIVLANEATTMCHGKDTAVDAYNTAQKTFTEGGIGESLPSIEKSQSEIEKGIDYISLLVETGLAESKGAARRLIQGGGARRNGDKIESLEETTHTSHIVSNTIKLSAGKKKHAIIKVA